MLETITPSEMRRLETIAIRQFGVSGEELMQRAAQGVADAVEVCLPEKKGVILCFCGTGNNGGDGLAAVRYLLDRHQGLKAVIQMLPGRLSPDCERERERLKAFEQEGRVQYDASLPNGGLAVIDALFGTGLNRPVEGEGLTAIKRIQHYREIGLAVISVDIPSGVHGETGNALGEAVYADVTVTLHRPKPGLYLREGLDHAGKVIVQDIGLKFPELEEHSPRGFQILEKYDLTHFLPKRPHRLHKGNCGRLLLYVGSFGMAGAAAIAATAALRTGAGLVTVACPEAIVSTVQLLCPCATCLPLPNDDTAGRILAEALPRFDAVGAGCGIGQSDWAKIVLKALIQTTASLKLPTVLDADALNLLGEIGLHGHPCCFLTPHMGEAARLLNRSLQELAEHPYETAKALQEEYPAGIVLKDACSLLVTADGMALNPYGTPAMAKGGSGDALTGVIAALLAGRKTGLYRMDDIELLQCACALHGLAGMAAERESGERGLLATELCAKLGLDFSKTE